MAGAGVPADAPRESSDKTPSSHTAAVVCNIDLAVRLRGEYAKTRNKEYLDEAIRIAREVVRTTQDDDPEKGRQLNLLGAALCDRHARTRSVADLEEGAQAIQKAIDITDESSPEISMYIGNLGGVLYTKYERTGELPYLEDSIQVTRQAVRQTPDSDTPKLVRLSNLANQLCERFSRTETRADIEEAIQILGQAILLTDDSSPSRGRALHDLSAALDERFLRYGDMSDLEKSAELLHEAIRITPKSDPGHGRYLVTLGIQLHRKYDWTGCLADLDESIDVTREAAGLVMEDEPLYAQLLSSIAGALGERYTTTGAQSDADEAVQSIRRAIDLTLPDDPDKATYLHNLGTVLANKYWRQRSMETLEEAIRVETDAIRMTPKNHPDQAPFLSNLGWYLYHRHKFLGSLADIREAVKFGLESVRLFAADHPERPGALNNAAISLAESYFRSGAINELRDSIDFLREAVEKSGRGNPRRMEYLHNLGIQLREKYIKSQVLADLDEAIRVTQESAELSPKGHPRLSSYLSTLGVNLYSRFEHTKEPADLERSIQVQRDAVSGIPEAQQLRADQIYQLAVALGSRYVISKQTADIEEAISLHKSIINQPATTMTTILAGKGMLQNYALISDWEQASKVSSAAVHRIRDLISESIEYSDSYSLLREVAGLTSDAAAASLQAGQGELAALHLIEQGRDLLAQSFEVTRASIADLENKHPDLASDLARLRNEVKPSPATETHFPDKHLEFSRQLEASRRYEASKELRRLMVTIRKKDGFKDFLGVPPEGMMQLAAAEKGPIVAINVSQYRCDAILVEHQGVRCLPLPDLKSEEVEMRANQGNLGKPEVLRWLWDVIGHPVLDALGFKESPTKRWPHVWWVLTGLLTKFPVHAAGYHSRGSSDTVVDRVVSSYSSSIKAIVHGRRRPRKPTTPSQALLISMEHTSDNSSLPFAAKEVELVHGLCSEMGIDPIQIRGCRQDVLSHLPQCQIFHFAGHGYTDPKNPSESHLLLENDDQDRKLTVANLLELNIRERPPFLAYLSACGTGQMKDARSFDESIHLISACQLVGFRHVIGTLWEVNDESCMDIARITYDAIQRSEMDDDSVCWGLHTATRELRDRWLNSVATNSGHESRLAEEKGALVNAAGIGGDYGKVNAANGSPTRGNLARDVMLKVDKPAPLALWVPYVHYGV